MAAGSQFCPAALGEEEVKLIQGTLRRLIPPHRPTDGPTVGPSVGRTVGGGEIHTESCKKYERR